MAATKYDWETCEILGSKISVYDLGEVVSRMRDLIDDGHKEYICVSNVHTTVTGKQDSAYRNITNGAIMATADGVPLIWASRLFKPEIRGRASGPDILNLFMQQDTDRRYRHFFFGSTKEVLARIKDQVELRWPGTQIAGVLSPPFGELGAADIDAHCNLINQSRADIVWVGLGAPKQEIWMARMRSRLKPSLLIGVGAAFDFLSGNKPRAPFWMQKAGLEWLFRLASEPKRLFKRYALTNTSFLAGIVAQLIRRK